jgi:hypothetical protein
MKVTIVGAGNMGRSRNPRGRGRPRGRDRRPRPGRGTKAGRRARRVRDCGRPGRPYGGEIVVEDPGIKEAVQQYADRLAGKVVVDITNPVDTQTWDRLATAPGSSSPEEPSSSFRRGRPS